MDPSRKLTWFVSLAVSILTALASFQDSCPLTWRFYVGLPGVLVGLYGGWLLDNQTIVLPATIAANAAIY